MPFDPADPEQAVFNVYGPAPLPDARDREVDEVVERLRILGPAEMSTVRRNASLEGRRVFSAYAARMASRAIRENNRDLLIRGLVAVIASGLSPDSREALMPMPLLVSARVDEFGLVD